MPVSRSVLGDADTFVRVLVRALRVRFLEGFFRLFGGVTRFGALSVFPNRLLCFTDSFVYEVACGSSVPTLQVPHCACVDKILPSVYICVILVNTTRNINEFLNNADCVVRVSDCKKVEFFLFHLGVSFVLVLVISCVSGVNIDTSVFVIVLLVFL